MTQFLKIIPIVWACSVFGATPFPPGTAFTYQGHLNDGANPANGSYDLIFSLYASSAGGVAAAAPLTNNATGITNGLIAVTLDFGNQFPGAERWLEIAVRTNGHGSFATLAPRQALTPTPYAIFAGNAANAATAESAASLTGTLPVRQLSGKILNTSLPANANFGGVVTATNGFVGDGSKVTNVNAATLNGLVSGSFWKNGGNAGANPTNGAYLGTTDNLPLEFRVNGKRALRIEDVPNSPNLLAGFAGNVISNGIYGSVIIGGGSARYPNRIGASYATVLGGQGNQANEGSSIAMGLQSTASGFASTAMGYVSTATEFASTAMGAGSTASGYASTAMGNSTTAAGESSTAMGSRTTASGRNSIAVGELSVASGVNSLAAGESAKAGELASIALGYQTTASAPGATALGALSVAKHNNTFVWSDGSPASPFASTANNQFLVYASGGVGIGTGQPKASLHVYSDNNPTVVRIQSSGGPGYGRVEFVSNPQGEPAEWRPGYIQSTDNGGFTGGLGFFVNGTGAPSLYGSLEVMRLVNGNVGIGTPAPASTLHVKSSGPDCEISIQSPDLFDPAGPDGSPPRAGHRWTLQSSSPIAAGHLAASFQIIDRTLGVSRMLIDAGGNVGIGTTSPSGALEVAGDILASGTVTGSSDRNVKEHFSPVDAGAVLEKVAALPISAWNYKADAGTNRHIGPMAQDFYAAFGVGQDDRHISMVDADGVALAAIQGLNRKLEEQKKERDAEIEKLKRQNSTLEQHLNELEGRMKALAERGERL